MWGGCWSCPWGGDLEKETLKQELNVSIIKGYLVDFLSSTYIVMDLNIFMKRKWLVTTLNERGVRLSSELIWRICKLMWLHHNAITNITFHWIWKVCGEVSIQEQTPKNLVFERDWTTWLEFVISTFYLLFLKGGVYYHIIRTIIALTLKKIFIRCSRIMRKMPTTPILKVIIIKIILKQMKSHWRWIYFSGG